MKKGALIVVEGLDGAGKSTQVGLLGERLIEKGVRFLAEREPSDGVLGAVARNAVRGAVKLSPRSLALVFAADRCEHAENVIKPAIDGGVHVICDRYVFSNFAYQGIDCSFDDIYAYNKQTLDTLMPDLTVFIDTTPKASLCRIEESRAEKEIFDEKGVIIRNNFFDAFEKLGGKAKVLVVDGDRPKEVVADEIWRAVEPLVCG